MTDFGASFGRDALGGGDGRDIFVFSTRRAKTEIDKILDFKVKDDSIWLDNAVFRKLGKGTEASPSSSTRRSSPSARMRSDKNDYLIYDPAKKTLFYDADGSGHGAAVAIVTFSQKQKLTAADLLVI